MHSDNLNAPHGLDSFFDLHPAISKYCALSPDPYARLHYESSIEHIDNPWNIVPASWRWLKVRMMQDVSPLCDIADDNCSGNWWESWENAAS